MQRESGFAKLRPVGAWAARRPHPTAGTRFSPHPQRTTAVVIVVALALSNAIVYLLVGRDTAISTAPLPERSLGDVSASSEQLREALGNFQTLIRANKNAIAANVERSERKDKPTADSSDRPVGSSSASSSSAGSTSTGSTSTDSISTASTSTGSGSTASGSDGSEGGTGDTTDPGEGGSSGGTGGGDTTGGDTGGGGFGGAGGGGDTGGGDTGGGGSGGGAGGG